MSKLLRLFAVSLAFVGVSKVSAQGIPVIDVANLANSVQQVAAWGQQYQQMVQQITSLEQQYQKAVQQFQSLNGIRGMADLVNNPLLRRYLPDDWNTTMNLLSSPGAYSGLSGSISAIRQAAQITSLASTGLSSSSSVGQAFIGSQTQAAMNRALGEAGFSAASDRITAIQTLLDKVNGAPDQKDILDLQARIQAEQAMVQNENVKLALMTQLQQAQRDIQGQQSRELLMNSSKSATGVPRF